VHIRALATRSHEKALAKIDKAPGDTPKAAITVGFPPVANGID